MTKTSLLFAVNGSVQEVDKFYFTEEQENAKLLKAIVEGKKEGRMNAESRKTLNNGCLLNR